MGSATLWTHYNVYGKMKNYHSKNIDGVVTGLGVLRGDF